METQNNIYVGLEYEYYNMDYGKNIKGKVIEINKGRYHVEENNDGIIEKWNYNEEEMRKCL